MSLSDVDLLSEASKPPSGSLVSIVFLSSLQVLCSALCSAAPWLKQVTKLQSLKGCSASRCKLSALSISRANIPGITAA